MTTIANFRVMPFEQKCDLITFTCTYLMYRAVGECKVFLYRSEEFFIEVFYSSKNSKVLMINAFDKADGLEPYLENISLTDLAS